MMTSTKSTQTPLKVLAFDPGFERLGLAIVTKENGKEVVLHSDCARTSASLSFPERLAQIGAAAEEAIRVWKPNAVAVENIFFEKNAKTAIGVAQVRGVLVYIASTHGLPVFEYTPLEVKVAVTGYGRGTKADIALMLPRLVKISLKKRLDDELDAIAIGLTCLASARGYPQPSIAVIAK